MAKVLDMNRKGAGIRMDIVEWPKWYDFNSPPTIVPSCPGVYEIRTDFEFGRLRGKSAVVYIGSAAKSLRERLINQRCAEPNQNLSRAEKLLCQVGHSLEFRYAVSTSAALARQLEAQELTRYEEEHWELPPGNSVKPKIRDK